MFMVQLHYTRIYSHHAYRVTQVDHKERDAHNYKQLLTLAYDTYSFVLLFGCHPRDLGGKKL